MWNVRHFNILIAYLKPDLHLINEEYSKVFLHFLMLIHVFFKVGFYLFTCSSYLCLSVNRVQVFILNHNLITLYPLSLCILTSFHHIPIYIKKSRTRISISCFIKSNRTERFYIPLVDALRMNVGK